MNIRLFTALLILCVSLPRMVMAAGWTAASRLMVIVAHEDDDLLFVNPTIANALNAGASVEVVFLTAGDAGLPASYWIPRETGITAAYATMAGAPGAVWTVSMPTYGGKTVYTRATSSVSNVKLVFLRLLDGGGDGSGFAASSDEPGRPGYASLWKLWSGQIANMPVAGTWQGPNGVSYTVSDLENVLRALTTDFAPTDIATLDSGGTEYINQPTMDFFYGSQHSDHLHAAKFAFRVHSAYGLPHTFSMYRDYNISSEAKNLSPNEGSWKWDIFAKYAVNDTALCGAGTPCAEVACTSACVSSNGNTSYPTWTEAQYPIRKTGTTTGWIAGIADKCLDISDGDATNGAPVQLWDCANVPWQQWQISNGIIKLVEGNKCLDLYANSDVDGSTVDIWDCNGTPAQSWTLLDNGMLRNANGKCLAATGVTNGTPVQLSTCERADAPNSNGYQYIVEPAQNWTVRFGTVDASFGSLAVSDSAANGTYGNYSHYYDTIRLADVDGDGRDDACARYPTGVFCQVSGTSTVISLTNNFRDVDGWNVEKYGITIGFGDINGDGRADLCGRGASGIWCATSTGSGFSSTSLRTNSFSDALGWGAASSRYASIHLADVNGDNLSDVCGRSSQGIVCAINDGTGTFAPAALWLTQDFTDQLTWADEQYGMTVQFADLNGDGKADVCGRGIEHITCALANDAGTEFDNPRRWSFRKDFSDADPTTPWYSARSYYYSIRLADVNGDGLADICGRSSTGIVCGWSNGLSFSPAQRVLPQNYTDNDAWYPDKYGTTIQFGRVLGSAKVDICGRGLAGLWCGTGMHP